MNPSSADVVGFGFVGIIVLLVFICIAIGITAAIGVFVYRDAKKRGMNAPLWTLVALVAPGLIGLIIYLVVRSDRDTRSVYCSSCGNSVDEGFNICPYCSAVLKPQCPQCSYPLSAGWYVCPSCGESIPDELRVQTTESSGSGERGLSAILIGVIAVPIVLIVLAIIICAMLFGRVGGPDIGGVYEESVDLSTYGILDAIIYASDDIKSVYSASVSFYSGEEKLLESAGISNADGTNMSKIDLYITIPNGADSCVIEFYGVTGTLLYRSEQIKLDGHGISFEGQLYMNLGKIELEY